jgi:signal transduction histidine kinase
MNKAPVPLQHEAALLLLEAERERARLARFIHDDLAQKLTVANMEMSLWRDEVKHGGPLSPAAIERKIAGLLELVGGVAKGVREVTGTLRPRMLDSFGLGAAVESLVRKCATRLGCSCEFHDASGGATSVTDLSIQFVRMAESVLNAVEGAVGGAVRGELKESSGAVELHVTATLPRVPEDAMARAKIFDGSIEQQENGFVVRLPKA